MYWFQIDFGTVRIGKTSVRKLCAKNPHEYPQQCVIEKFPLFKDFTIDLTEFYVDAGKNVRIAIKLVKIIRWY